MEFSESLGDFILVYSVVQKLDKRSRQLFESKPANYDFPTFKIVIDLLRDHCKSLDATYLSTEKNKLSVGPNKSTYVYNQPRSHTNSMNSKTQSFIASTDKPNISATGYNQKYENNQCMFFTTKISYCK